MTTIPSRDEVIAGLRDLADLLENNPGLPVPKWGEDFSVHVGTDTQSEGDAAGMAEVDAAAGVLGQDAAWKRVHYMVTRELAGGISYQVLYIPVAEIERHHAQQSYRDNIQVGAA